MDTLLIGRVFDTITGNIEYERDGNYKYPDRTAFPDLVKVIYECTGKKEKADVLDFTCIVISTCGRVSYYHQNPVSFR